MSKNYARCKGIEELEARIDELVGGRETAKCMNGALEAGAAVFAEAIKKNIQSAKDEGYAKGWTVKDTTIGRPGMIKGQRLVRIGWNGTHGRYRIIHLNEFGYTKWGRKYRPPRMGSIQKAIDGSSGAAMKAVKNYLKEELKHLQ